MNFKYKLFTIILIFTLLPFAGAATTTNQVNSFINDLDLQGQNNSKELAYQIGENASKEGMNADIYELNFANHIPVWVVTLYPEAQNAKGYSARYFWLGPQKKEVLSFTKGAMYYQDFGKEDTGCRIKDVCSYKMVKSYFGENETLIEDNVTHETVNNTTVEEVTEEVCEVSNNTSEPQETVSNTSKKASSTVKMYMENSSSGESVDITGHVNTPASNETEGYWVKIFHNAWKAVFGGN